MCYVRECLDFGGDNSRCPARRQERTAACGESSTSSEAASSCPQVKPSCYVTGFLLVQITVMHTTRVGVKGRRAAVYHSFLVLLIYYRFHVLWPGPYHVRFRHFIYPVSLSTA